MVGLQIPFFAGVWDVWFHSFLGLSISQICSRCLRYSANKMRNFKWNSYQILFASLNTCLMICYELCFSTVPFSSTCFVQDLQQTKHRNNKRTTLQSKLINKVVSGCSVLWPNELLQLSQPYTIAKSAAFASLVRTQILQSNADTWLANLNWVGFAILQGIESPT